VDELHYLNVGPAGTFQATGSFHSTPKNVEDIIAHIESQQRNHIGVFLHGGLVDEVAGMAGAKRFRDVFAGADTHGVSLVWETGWWETIQKNLTDVFSTELFQRLVEKVIEKVVAHFTGLGARGPGGADVEADAVLRDPDIDHTFADQTRTRAEQLSAKNLDDWRKELEAELEAEIDADDEFQSLYVDPAQRTPLFDDPTQPVQADPQAPRERAVVSWFTVAAKIAAIAWRVGKRFWNGRDHRLHATAVEEVFREFYLADLIKTLEWDNMKQAAREMWLPNDGLTGTAQHAGTYLIEQLMALKQRRPSLTVDLVAHSAGAIVACELFAALGKRYTGKLSIRNVIFLAPASTSLLFHATMLHSQPQFDEFYLFTMPDDLERRDAVLRPAHNALAVVYPGSLLYVVSGMLEDEVDAPLLGMLRFGSGEAPFDAQKLQKIRDYLATPGKQRLTLSAADGQPPAGQLASQATSHGAFSSDKVTMDSIQRIIKQSNDDGSH
jgi:hypothetical protein